ncbi:hypothetical protein APICC_09972 [Apis cerana cerana]|uniref:Uncharacterized protein n=1 Tax=Apis cerana cerana TaxID=94128 RepID=A0A2A3EQD8_APICC|nr:hypothetical protein APICC_09972 [Apis cerana cerana]
MMDVEETNTASTASSSPRPSSPAADSTFIRSGKLISTSLVIVFKLKQWRRSQQPLKPRSWFTVRE